MSKWKEAAAMSASVQNVTRAFVRCEVELVPNFHRCTGNEVDTVDDTFFHHLNSGHWFRMLYGFIGE